MIGLIRNLLFIFFCLTPSFVFSQGNDSIPLLTEEDFLALVMQHHPAIYRADMANQIGEAGLLKAKGAFDPVLGYNLDNKRFQDDPYYLVSNAGLKIPVWPAMEVFVGYDYTSGIQLNPENKLPVDGQAVAGIGIDLGKGLLFDDRRYALRMGQLGVDMSEAERQQIRIQLKRDARIVYWQWVAAWTTYQLNIDALQVTSDRFDAVVKSFLNGSIPAIDTVEAELQIYIRQAEVQKSQKELIKANYSLSNFLWKDGSVPVELDTAVRPAPLPQEMELPPLADSILGISTALNMLQPELQMYDFKLQGLDFERKLARESLRPEINLKYQMLGDAFNFGSGPTPFYTDYKLGLQFKFPIILREARGKLQQIKLKYESTEFEFSEKSRSFQNKLFAMNELLRTNLRQFEISQSAISNYRTLLEGEQRRFFLGSSSIFLINSREQKLLEAQTKLIELQANHFIYQAEMEYLIGR
jgi:outer membrane protein TolC